MASSNGLPVSFQLITLSITTAILAYFIAGQVYNFCAVDQKPTVHRTMPSLTDALTDQKYTNKKKNETTAKINPDKVIVGLTITDFPEFNMTENKFKITGIISFAYDPKKVDLATFDNFSFLRGEVEHKSKAHRVQHGDITIAYYEITVAFKTNLYYGFFPFEDHRMFLTLVADPESTGKIAFEAQQQDFIIDPEVYINGWSYISHKVKTGYAETIVKTAHVDKHIILPAVLFSIDFFHYSLRYIISIILPLLIIFFIDMFSFCLDQEEDHETLVQMSTGNIVALVAYRFVIENLSPKVGYPMIADFIFFLFLSISFSVFIINAIGPYLTQFQRKAVSIAFQLVVIGVFTYLLEFWIPC